MCKVKDFLQTCWDEQGVVLELSDIEEALENEISYEEMVNIPQVVENFMQFIIPEEGEILYGK